MNDFENDSRCPVSLEINISHRYLEGALGIVEFRIKNLGSSAIRALYLSVDCPCRDSRKKSATLKNITPASEKLYQFQFAPSDGGEGLLEIELVTEGLDQRLQVYCGQTSVSISSGYQKSSSPTSFTVNIHDIQKLMGNDLSGLVTMAGQELNEDRLREKMERKEPLWMRIDLDLDEHETIRRRAAKRDIIHVPGGRPPFRSSRAVLESEDSSAPPQRLFIYSGPQIRFGRSVLKNDAVIRFLPDFNSDERSLTISSEQFVAQYRKGSCFVTLANQARASMCVNGRAALPDEQIAIESGSTVAIGSHELTLKTLLVDSGTDPSWERTREEIIRFDPGDDPFKETPCDLMMFSRRFNGEEESYSWLFRKMDFSWDDGATGLEFGNAVIDPKARLSFWNGRYYLEPVGVEVQIRAGACMLQTGQIACLGVETDLAFGPLQFHWRLPKPTSRTA